MPFIKVVLYVTFVRSLIRTCLGNCPCDVHLMPKEVLLYPEPINAIIYAAGTSFPVDICVFFFVTSVKCVPWAERLEVGVDYPSILTLLEVGVDYPSILTS